MYVPTIIITVATDPIMHDGKNLMYDQAFNPLRVKFFSTRTLIINKNSFLQLLYIHTLINRYQVEAHTFSNKMAVVTLPWQPSIFVHSVI